jgi:ABC-type multidrug transport system permease subunit
MRRRSATLTSPGPRAGSGYQPAHATRQEKVMFYIGDLFQWERFITPSIIKLFYWLIVIIVIFFGLSGLVTALGTFTFNPIAGVFTALASFAGMLVGILAARIAAEFVLMVFRISEHLSAIRNRGGM